MYIGKRRQDRNERTENHGKMLGSRVSAKEGSGGERQKGVGKKAGTGDGGREKTKGKRGRW